MDNAMIILQKAIRPWRIATVVGLLALSGCSDGAGTDPFPDAYPPESEIDRPPPPGGDGDMAGDGDGDGDGTEVDAGTDGGTSDSGTGDGDSGGDEDAGL